VAVPVGVTVAIAGATVRSVFVMTVRSFLDISHYMCGTLKMGEGIKWRENKKGMTRDFCCGVAIRIYVSRSVARSSSKQIPTI
jgi:hypothetical protein